MKIHADYTFPKRMEIAMSKRKNPWRKMKSRNKNSMPKDIREELRFRNSLLRFRGYLLDQMETEFDRVLSGRLDAIDFLLRTCPIGKKNIRRILKEGKEQWSMTKFWL